MLFDGFSKDELRFLRKFDSPKKIQDFIDAIHEF